MNDIDPISCPACGEECVAVHVSSLDTHYRCPDCQDLEPWTGPGAAESVGVILMYAALLPLLPFVFFTMWVAGWFR